MRRAVLPLIVLLGLLTPGAAGAIGEEPGITSGITRSYLGIEANDMSEFGGPHSLSQDGREAVFASYASNLIQGDLNRRLDVFVSDLDSKAIRRVSVSSEGVEANGESFGPSISPDGRHVAFSSTASNLVPGDTNGQADAFVADLETGIVERVSVATDGTQSNSWSLEARVSSGGRFVIFTSRATTLVPNDTNGVWDVFLRDRVSGGTSRVSVGDEGQQGNGHAGNPSMSEDGRFLVFSSWATNLLRSDVHGSLDVFVRDRQTGGLEIASVSSAGTQGEGSSYEAAMSPNGRFVAFTSTAWNLTPGDTNLAEDVFVRDRVLGTTKRGSLDSLGAQRFAGAGRPSGSADGRYVLFITQGDFTLTGADVEGVDVYLHDFSTGRTTEMSVSTAGTPGYGNGSYDLLDFAGISADGRRVVFSYRGLGLDATTGMRRDIYMRERMCLDGGC